jgi:LacI family transcriptional regulator
MSVRLLDIAKRAKVSLPVVSSVVNHSRCTAMVSPAKREKILAIAKEMGYTPNAAARATRQGRFNRIAAAVVQYGPPGTSYAPSNGYLDTAINELAERGYSLVFEPLHLDFKTDRFFEPPRLFSELAVDGVLGLPVSGFVPPQVDEQLAGLKASVIWMNRNPEETTKNVMCDEPAGTKILLRHLLDLGHRRIGYVGYKTSHYAGKQRYETVKSELAAAGLDTSGLMVAEHVDFLMDVIEPLLDRRPLVTAMICYNHMAYRTALHCMARRGLKVPDDISLCYFASPWELGMTRFDVTVLVVPEARMAETAVQMLVDLIEEKEFTEPGLLIGTLHSGQTTAPIHTGGI